MMTNQTIELMGRHASVRKFKPERLPPEAVETIVAAAQRASTAANFQVVSVVAVAEPERRATLSKICGQEHVAQAPVVLIWCADLRRLDRACQLRGYVQETRYVENLVTCAVDVGIAAQNGGVYDQTMIATGIYEGRQVPVPGKPGQAEAYGWLEHCARRVSQPVRVELSEALRKQGFGLR
jgi:FMN reductase (NADPH)